VTKDEIAAHNREMLPAVAELMAEVRQVFPKARLIHAVDHTTQCEVGRPGVDKLTPSESIARRCDESA
jgi:hypothetical protein